jgi:hypothetical protein
MRVAFSGVAKPSCTFPERRCDFELVQQLASAFRVSVDERPGGRLPRRRRTGRSLFEQVGERDPRRGPLKPGTRLRAVVLEPDPGAALSGSWSGCVPWGLRESRKRGAFSRARGCLRGRAQGAMRRRRSWIRI